MKFDVGSVTLIFLGFGLLFVLILLLILLAGRKKPTVSKGKKAFAIIMVVLSSVCFAVSPLVYYNYIPLSMWAGYYIEVNDMNHDNKTNGYKVTMEGKVYYYETMETNRLDKQSTEKGSWRYVGNHAIFEFANYGVHEYTVEGLGRKLCIDGKTAFLYVRGI